MDWKKEISPILFQLWMDHRKVVVVASFFILFGCWLNPLIQQVSYKNQCIRLATKEFLSRSSVETNVLSKRELARTEAYRFCNHI